MTANNADRERLIAALEAYGMGGGYRALLTGQAIAAAEMLRADAQLHPEEVAYLLASERCDECGHLSALHDVETIRCEICECRTDGLNI